MPFLLKLYRFKEIIADSMKKWRIYSINRDFWLNWFFNNKISFNGWIRVSQIGEVVDCFIYIFGAERCLRYFCTGEVCRSSIRLDDGWAVSTNQETAATTINQRFRLNHLFRLQNPTYQMALHGFPKTKNNHNQFKETTLWSRSMVKWHWVSKLSA